MPTISTLYAIEREQRDSSSEERKAGREHHSRPNLDKIKAWLDEKVTQVLPKGLLDKAIAYTLGLWPQLTTSLEDGIEHVAQQHLFVATLACARTH